MTKYHNYASMNAIDSSSATISNDDAVRIASVISLDRFADNDYITKTGMAQIFRCSERTIQHMVERFELPPPTTMAGRKVWRAGKVKAWLVQADDRIEAEALKEAKRLRVFG